MSSVHRESPGLVYLRGKIPLSDLQGIFHAHFVHLHIQKLRVGGLMSSLLTSQPSYPHNSFREKTFSEQIFALLEVVFFSPPLVEVLTAPSICAHEHENESYIVSTISEHISQGYHFKRLNVSALKY